jgi:hypothetical protein
MARDATMMTQTNLPPAASTAADKHATFHRCILGGAVVLALLIPAWVFSDRIDPAPVPAPAASTAVAPPKVARLADFGAAQVSADARHIADWIADSRDNGQVDFVIVDKKFARVHVFDAAARLRSSSVVLLGSARGDDSVPGIGSKPIAQVLPSERTTPAGRFLAQRGRNTGGEDVVWVDYEAAVSMHRVRATNPKERRLARLATASTDDKRISFGCINVPASFFDAYIVPVFATRRALVYVLPEVKTAKQVFGSYDVATPATPAAH